jgi:hypothetical protein
MSLRGLETRGLWEQHEEASAPSPYRSVCQASVSPPGPSWRMAAEGGYPSGASACQSFA